MAPFWLLFSLIARAALQSCAAASGVLHVLIRKIELDQVGVPSVQLISGCDLAKLASRKLDKVIASVSREEEKKLLDRWISLSVPEGVDLGLVLRWAGGIGTAVVVVVILVIVAWNRRLGREVAERKRTEEALRESEARAKAILNTAFTLQGLLKLDGTLIEANAAALSMINVSKEDVAGQPFWDCPWWTHNPDLQVQLRQAVKQAADGEAVQFLATHPTPDGIEHIIDFRVTPVTDENGEVALIVPEGHDITDLKQAEAELRQAKEQAETALAELSKTQQQLVVSEKMASLGQVTAGIAHEIKNPLNFINNFAELSVELIDQLRDAIKPARQSLNGEQQDDLDDLVTTLSANMVRIDEQGRRADSIVKSMLQHSRYEGSERRHIDINAFLEENLKLAYHGARARDQAFNIALERDFDPNAGSIYIAAQDISRVLLNLFSNGIYATHQRQHLETSADYAPVLRVSSRSSGDRVEIRVRDNGTGIPDDILNKIFDPFFTTKPTGEGTGLGLSLSYETVVHQHTGSLRAESEAGSFTEFILVLPRGPELSPEPVT